MKKFLHVFVVISIVAILGSCSKSDTSNPNYLKIDATSHSLSSGLIDDNGTTLSATPPYRDYGILLQDKETNPTVFIKFNVYSTSTTQLATGTYTYDYSGDIAGTYSYFHYGYGIAWDNAGVETAGTFFNESSTNIVSGSKITISKSGDNYVFDVDMTVKVSGSSVAIKGHFEEVLTAQSYLPVYYN